MRTDLTNQGLLQGAAGTVRGNFINSGEAQISGALNVQNFSNDGTTRVDGQLTVNGFTLNTGVISGTGTTSALGLTNKSTGLIEAGPSGFFIQSSGDVRNEGITEIPDGGSLFLSGPIVNQGSIALEGTSSATLRIGDFNGGGATLTGGGQVTLSDNPNDAILGASSNPFSSGPPPAHLTSEDNTISGAGVIGGAFVSEL